MEGALTLGSNLKLLAETSCEPFVAIIVVEFDTTVVGTTTVDRSN
jgi:hypothetical protein